MRNIVKPEELVVSYELAIKLRDIGVPQVSLWAWKTYTAKIERMAQFNGYELKRMIPASQQVSNDSWDYEWIAAFTAEELVHLLPENIYTYSHVEDGKRAFYAMRLEDELPEKAESLANVMATYLLLEERRK